MKSIVFAAALLVGLGASAHIEKGIWIGTAAGSNTACSMEVGLQTYEGNFQHPLNERIQLSIGQTQFSIHHPSVIDAKTYTASFNHDLFEGVIPTKTGAIALVVNMSHTPEYEGPTQFTVMENDWKTGAKKGLTCLNIKHQAFRR